MDTGHIKSFVTETEIEERRKRRQEEWEKVRNSDEPESCPDETDQWDGKTLYQRLQEVKEAKDLEFEEQFKFKNMIYKGLDDDEAKFLSNVSQQRAEVDRQRRETEKKFLEECREAMALADLEKKTDSYVELTTIQPTNRKSQQSLLVGSIKRKGKSTDVATQSENKKLCTEDYVDKEQENAYKGLAALVDYGDDSSSDEV